MAADYSKLVEKQEQVVTKVQDSLLTGTTATPELLEAGAKALEIHVGVLEALETKQRRASK